MDPGPLAWLGLAAAVLLAAVFVHDRWFSHDNVLRNFPVVGHLRHLLIEIGPELRQYIVAGNREEAPFNREEREWIYRSARGQNNFFGFGTDDQIYGIGYPIIKHAVFPHGQEGYTGSSHDRDHEVPCAKVMGEVHGRLRAWRPRSIVNISAMSFGALSANAIRALNLGAREAGCWHNTGEGGFAPHHQLGGDVIFQIGTGNFGCRDRSGRFSPEALLATLGQSDRVRAIEVKLSQGAKPGKGGVLPGRKVSAEIARIRGVPPGQDCISPNGSTEFKDIAGLIRFVEELARLSGLPVGIKSAVGHLEFWRELAQEMRATGKGPDFVTIDGGEGGTGAAPLTFADHVSLPFRVGFTRVYRTFLEERMAERVLWVGSGKLGFPDRAIVAFALGADAVSIAREAMLSIGCIQAQKCHTGRCPTGIATQDRGLQRAVEPEVQGRRFAAFCRTLRNEILAVTHACGHEHPAQFTADDVEVSSGPGIFQTARQIHGYTPERTWTGIPGWSG